MANFKWNNGHFKDSIILKGYIQAKWLRTRHRNIHHHQTIQGVNKGGHELWQSYLTRLCRGVSIALTNYRRDNGNGNEFYPSYVE